MMKKADPVDVDLLDFVTCAGELLCPAGQLQAVTLGGFVGDTPQSQQRRYSERQPATAESLGSDDEHGHHDDLHRRGRGNGRVALPLDV